MSMFREHWIGGLVTYTSFFVISFGIALTGNLRVSTAN